MEEVYAYLIGKKETGLEEKTLAKLTISAVLLIAAVLVLSGISKRGDLIYETPRFARGLQNGTYSAQKENQFSTVRVDMTIEDDRIEDCRITSSGAADLLTDEIRSAWANAIVEGQDPAPEAITGATLVFSAASVQEAVQDILAQAAGEKEPEVLPEIEAPAASDPAPTGQETTAAQGQDGCVPDPAAEAPAQTVPPEPDPDRLMRKRPAAVSAQPARPAAAPEAGPAAETEPSADAEPLPEAEPEAPAEAGDPDRLMRKRPAAVSAQPARPAAAPEAEPAAETEPSADAEPLPEAEAEAPAEAGDPDRLMRARPAEADAPEEAEPGEVAPLSGDALRLMRRRP